MTDKTVPWLSADHPEAIACLVQVKALAAQLKATSIGLTGVGLTVSSDKQSAAIQVNVERRSDVPNVPSYFEGYEVITRVTGKIRAL
jgi:hypothetical protein